MFDVYDVIVVGAGHAGCEAAAAAANLGSKTLLITMSLQNIAQMSCNPAMGGIAKGQIVREIDALGGYSGIVSDKTAIQFNLNKGNLQGKFVINNAEGKPDYECSYKDDVLDGARIEYYPNGKVYKKENFVNNEYDGKQEYFKEDGQLWASISIKKDELHGDSLLYNAGKLVETKKYDSDESVGISK